MKQTPFIFVFLFAFSCLKKEGVVSKPTFLDFNEKASDSFLKNFDSYDFGSMSELNRCILKTGVSSYLNRINDWKLSVIDSFYVRNYDFTDLGIQFSFVANQKGDYYFIYLPHLTDYLVHNLYFDDYYDYEDNGELTLKDSLALTVSKINSVMLDSFLKHEVLNTNDHYKQYMETQRLLEEFYPFLLADKIHLHTLLEELENEPEKNKTYITQFINPMLNRSPTITKGSNDYRLYRLGPVGWILVDYFLADPNSDSISVDIYFIARKHSVNIGHETERHKYKECFEQFGEE